MEVFPAGKEAGLVGEGSGLVRRLADKAGAGAHLAGPNIYHWLDMPISSTRVTNLVRVGSELDGEGSILAFEIGIHAHHVGEQCETHTDCPSSPTYVSQRIVDRVNAAALVGLDFDKVWPSQ